MCCKLDDGLGLSQCLLSSRLGFVGRVVSTVVQAEMVKEGYNLLWLLLLFGGNADVLGKVRPSWCFGQHREKVFRVFNGCSR